MLSICKPLRGRRSLPVESVSVAGELIEGDSELRATLTLQREWRKMAARVSECISE